MEVGASPAKEIGLYGNLLSVLERPSVHLMAADPLADLLLLMLHHAYVCIGVRAVIRPEVVHNQLSAPYSVI